MNERAGMVYATIKALNLARSVGEPTSVLTRIYANVAFAAGMLGQRTVADRFCSLASRELERSEDAATRAWALLPLGAYRTGQGEWQDAQRLLADGLRTAREMGHFQRCCEYQTMQLLVSTLLGNHDAALSQYEKLQADSEDKGLVQYACWGALGKGRILARQGRFDGLRAFLPRLRHLLDRNQGVAGRRGDLYDYYALRALSALHFHDEEDAIESVKCALGSLDEPSLTAFVLPGRAPVAAQPPGQRGDRRTGAHVPRDAGQVHVVLAHRCTGTGLLRRCPRVHRKARQQGGPVSDAGARGGRATVDAAGGSDHHRDRGHLVSRPRSRAAAQSPHRPDDEAGPGSRAPTTQMSRRHLLVIGAHPDDAEFHAGGLIHRWRQRADEVTLLSMTDGSAGHHIEHGPQLAARRRAEAQAAAAVTGARAMVLPFPDGALQASLDARHQLIEHMRRLAPDLVVTHRPCDYHPDHRATAQLVQDALYLLTVPAVVPQAPVLRQTPVVALMGDLFERPAPLRADVVLDVDDDLAVIIDMLACHASQVFEWLPWTRQRDAEVPAGVDARRRWLERFYRPRPRALARRFAHAVSYAEVYEICEYGRQPANDELDVLFPGRLN